jgi:hypothetical protein
MPWINEGVRPLVESVLELTAAPIGALPAGEHEVRIGLDAAAGGITCSAGVHGRLKVRAVNHPYQQLIELALGITLGKVPAAGRAKLVKELAAAAAAADPETVFCLQDARKILRQLRRKTGIEWRDTPTYKPRA